MRIRAVCLTVVSPIAFAETCLGSVRTIVPTNNGPGTGVVVHLQTYGAFAAGKK